MIDSNNTLSVAVLVKLEPDLSEGSVTYNPDGTLNRSLTKNILGPHSAIACRAARYAKVCYNATVKVCTMGPPNADLALKEAMSICDADELHLYTDRIFAGADTLATAEVLKHGILRISNSNDRGIDIVFAGHRAVDGETGQTGPQTAWKLGFNFIGNVIDYRVNLKNRSVWAKRRVDLPSLYTVIEEVESPLPVLIALDPSYKDIYTTVSQRLRLSRIEREANERSKDYKRYLKVWSAKDLGVDVRYVGLAGSPTIVYKVERIPKVKASRRSRVVNADIKELREVAEYIVNLVIGER
jgi:Electron transfer flavoprotein, beta subunit